MYTLTQVSDIGPSWATCICFIKLYAALCHCGVVDIVLPAIPTFLYFYFYAPEGKHIKIAQLVVCHDFECPGCNYDIY